ncbi:MAG: DUF952 domain-containing protein [Beijerinckiaceae bacterium]|nr:DUF952 domain-containing protein [Beijerinckiaceae bacterium]
MDLIYKIIPDSLWRHAREIGAFEGAEADRADGFLHFSSAAQVQATAEKYFKGRGGLVLIAVESDRLGEALKFEPSRGGALFPHLYGPLPLAAVLWARPIPLLPDGTHDFACLAEP